MKGIHENQTSRDSVARWASVLLIGLLTAASQLPWLLAWAHTSPGHLFTGYMGGLEDYWSYLSKMRQGWDGHWTWANLYDATGMGRWFLYPFYLGLGHVARWLKLDFTALPLVFHAAAGVMTAVALIAVWQLIKRSVPDQRMRAVALVVAFLASSGAILMPDGMAWSPLAHNLDLYPPPHFYAGALYYPHYLLDIAGLAGVMTLLLDQVSVVRWWRWPAIAALSAMVSLIHPHVAAVGLAAMGLYSLTLSGHQRWLGLTSTAVATGGALPYSLYVWYALNSSELALWRAQAVAQPPALAAQPFLFGVGLFLAVAALPAAWKARGGARLAAIWLPLAFILANTPLPLLNGSGELLMGLSVPAGILIARSLTGRPDYAQTWGVIGSVTGAVVVFVTLTVTVWLPGPTTEATTYLPGAALRQVAALTGGAQTVVAAPAPLGTELPWLAGVRVVWGHPVETPHSRATLTALSRFCRGGMTADEEIAFRRRFHIAAVLPGDPSLWPLFRKTPGIPEAPGCRPQVE